jgi:hypothetical protein
MINSYIHVVYTISTSHIAISDIHKATSISYARDSDGKGKQVSMAELRVKLLPVTSGACERWLNQLNGSSCLFFFHSVPWITHATYMVRP